MNEPYLHLQLSIVCMVLNSSAAVVGRDNQGEPSHMEEGYYNVK